MVNDPRDPNIIVGAATLTAPESNTVIGWLKKLYNATIVVDSSGEPIVPDSYAQTITYNGDDTVNTISFTDGVNIWTQTFSYTSGLVTGISTWVKS